MDTEETQAILPGESDGPLRFGDYEILGTIGHGGFASVYRAAFHGSFGFRKQVALKVLHRRFDSVEEQASAEFLNEARLGASIRHPNLVEFYECGRVGDRLYIAMELVDGPNLAQVLQLGAELTAPITDDVIVAMAMQMARGLDGLHSAVVDDRAIGAVHRDFKPGNILISSLGQAKITDYGITSFAADFYQTLDRAGPRGSPLYMSPEQVRGSELTQASDVFAFGSTVLEMILGRPVFLASTVDDIVRKVGAAEVGEALTAARVRFPALVPVLENCMLPRASSRYQNGAELVEGMHGVRPPPFGDELIGKVSLATMEIIGQLEAKRARRPVDRFWCLTSELRRDGEGKIEAIAPPEPVPLEATPDAPQPSPWSVDGEAGPATTEEIAVAEPVAEPVAEESPTTRRTALYVGISAAVLLLLIAVAVVPPLLQNRSTTAALPRSLAEQVATEVATEIAVPDEESPTEVEVPSDPTPPPPIVAEVTAAVPASEAAQQDAGDDADASAGALDSAGAGPPRLFHDPVSRGIRGQAVSFQVQVDPPGSYRSTVWYRAVPDGAWQTDNVDGGADGTLTVVIPAGVWLSQEATDVEYFIEVAGPGGLARSASAVRPYSFQLY